MKNFVFKKVWLDEMSQLPVEFQAAIVLAANNYAYFGTLPADPVVAFAMRHIIADIDRKKAAQEKRNRKQAVEEDLNQKPKNDNNELILNTDNDITVKKETKTSGDAEPTPDEETKVTAKSILPELTLTEKRYLAIKKKVSRHIGLSPEELKIYRRYQKREQLAHLHSLAG